MEVMQDSWLWIVVIGLMVVKAMGAAMGHLNTMVQSVVKLELQLVIILVEMTQHFTL